MIAWLDRQHRALVNREVMPRTANSRLRLLLERADWNQNQVAHALRKVAAEDGQHLACDATTVRRWLAGTQPRPPTAAYLLEALSRRLGRPVTAQEAGLTQAPPTMMAPFEEADTVRQLAMLTTPISTPPESTCSVQMFSASPHSHPRSPTAVVGRRPTGR